LAESRLRAKPRLKAQKELKISWLLDAPTGRERTVPSGCSESQSDGRPRSMITVSTSGSRGAGKRGDASAATTHRQSWPVKVDAMGVRGCVFRG